MKEKKHCYVFCKGKLLVETKDNNTHSIPQLISLSELTNAIPQQTLTVTMNDGEQCLAYSISEEIEENATYTMIDLRQSYFTLSKEDYLKAGKASELLHWDCRNKFCGVCGHPMIYHTDISRRCPECGNEAWPSPATAIIVLVQRDDKVLLVHAHNFRGNFFGLVAGFLETGETLEQCVEREVLEETGIRVKNVRYYKNQPWPYPFGQMVGFFADYDSGEIKLQEEELEKGAWFTRENLPEIPPPLSMARMLLDEWIRKGQKSVSSV